MDSGGLEWIRGGFRVDSGGFGSFHVLLLN